MRGRYFVETGGPGRTFRAVDDDRCLEAHASGAVELSEDYGSVRPIAPGSRLVVTETRDGVTRRLVLGADSSRARRSSTSRGPCTRAASTAG